MGRVFTEEEDKPTADPVIVISNRYWKTRYGGDKQILGRTLRLNGKEARIIGVMPDRFETLSFLGRSICGFRLRLQIINGKTEGRTTSTCSDG
jgi:hypothetical protein